MGNKTLESFLTWLFELESITKRTILVTCDSIIIPLSVLLALAARLESHSYQYHVDS